MKPLGRKSYDSIPHLPSSRVGQAAPEPSLTPGRETPSTGGSWLANAVTEMHAGIPDKAWDGVPDTSTMTRPYRWTKESRDAMSRRLQLLWEERRANGYTNARQKARDNSENGKVRDPETGLGYLDRAPKGAPVPRTFEQSVARVRDPRRRKGRP